MRFQPRRLEGRLTLNSWVRTPSGHRVRHPAARKQAPCGPRGHAPGWPDHAAAPNPFQQTFTNAAICALIGALHPGVGPAGNANPFIADIRQWPQQYDPGLGTLQRIQTATTSCPAPHRAADFLRVLFHQSPTRSTRTRVALLDSWYHAGLEQFGRDLAALSGPMWESECPAAGRPRAEGPA